MRILITGASGQLGHELKSSLESMQCQIGKVDEAYRNAQVDYADHASLDIASLRSVASWFANHAVYDLIINAASMTNVDGCEKNEALAYKVNAHGPEYLASMAQKQGAKFVQVSTDYVFSGTDPAPRNESDQICPVSAYGRSKLAGEFLAQAECERTFIVRTAWLYGSVGKNFVKTMIRLASERHEINVVADQFGNPTSANDLSYEILKLALTDHYGIYHVTNEGWCSWFDFACAVVDGLGIECQKHPLSSAQYKALFPQSADRPHYSALENRHLMTTIGNQMRPWQEALKSFLCTLPKNN